MEKDVAKTHRVGGAIVRELDKTLDMTYNSTFQDTLREIALQIRLLIGAEQSAVSYIPDGDFKQAIHTCSFSAKYEKYNSYDVMPTGEGIWAVVVEKCTAMRMTDKELKSHARWRNFSNAVDDRGLEHPEMIGWLAVPVTRQNGDFIGLLQLTCKENGDFTEEDEENLTRFARVAGLAFELYYINSDLQKETMRAEQAEKNLERKIQELAHKNKELEQFSYIASHDLQEPLRTVKNFVNLLNQEYRDKLDHNAKEYLDFIMGSSERMHVLIKGLLDYAQIGHNTKLLTIDCRTVVREILSDLTMSINESDVQIDIGKLPTLDVYATEFRQLLQNLISNAVKFRRPGVTPKIKIDAQRQEGNWLFSISDNGIGFDDSSQEKIFLIFQRLHQKKDYAGTGIGLAHCKKIVELHGGNIWVKSTPGQGSTFFFTISDQQSVKKPLECVLLVDDNEADNYLHKRIISKSGLCKRIVVCMDGQEALEFLTTKDKDHYSKPDLILLDINMPRVDGWTFLKRYKELKEEHSAVVIMMLTTSLNPRDEQKAASIKEITEFYPKPLTFEMWHEIYKKHFCNGE